MNFPCRLTHGPPSGILDLAQEVNPVGCEALRDRLPYLQPRLHVFGHIHEAHGVEFRTYTNMADGKLGLSDAIEDRQALSQLGHHTVFANAANMPLGSRAHVNGKSVPVGGPGFQPVVVDLKDNISH